MDEQTDSVSDAPEEVQAEETVATEETTTEAPAEELALEEAADGQENDASLKARLSDDDYAYVQKLRSEAAEGRTTSKRFKEAFEGYDDETVDAYLEAVQAIQNDPAAAHAAFSELVAALAEAAGVSTEEAQELIEEAAEEDGSDEIRTKADLEKFLAEKEEAKKQEEGRLAAVKEVDDTIESLGYKPDTADYTNLLFFASQKESGSVAEKLQAADADVKAYRQQIVDDYVAGEAAKLEQTPPQTDGASPTPARPEKPKSIAEAAKRARVSLDAMYSEADGE